MKLASPSACPRKNDLAAAVSGSVEPVALMQAVNAGGGEQPIQPADTASWKHGRPLTWHRRGNPTLCARRRRERIHTQASTNA